MDPRIAEIFLNSTQISGKTKFKIDLTSYFFSIQGSFFTPHEGVSQKEKVKGSDPRRERNGEIKVEDDQGEARAA